MVLPTEVRRVVVVVLDGLRPDAIDAFDLVNVRQLMQIGASSMCAQTVRPSLTWPALTSLLTGVGPDVHGVLADAVQIPRPRTRLTPLPELLLKSGYPSSAFMEELPPLYRVFGGRIAERLGFHHTRFSGRTAPEVLLSARSQLRTQTRGLIFMHWADADRAGHAHGWMSDNYREAACRLDAALGMLAAGIAIDGDTDTMLIVLADHGGGGAVVNNHEADHPLNTTIPLIVAGAGVTPGALDDAMLIDVPPTVARALGIAAPSSWSGRSLLQPAVALGLYKTSAVPMAMTCPTSTSPG